MNLRQLEYFSAVARFGGFAAASRKMNVAQSAISRQIAGLEAELRAQLFNRLGRQIEITEIGKSILDEVEYILQRVERLRVIAAQEKSATTVMLGASHSFGNFLFPRLSISLAQTERGIAIGFAQGSTSKLLDLVGQGKVDLCILSQLEGDPVPTGADMELQLLCREQLHLVGRRDLLTTEQPISAREALANRLVLMPSGNVERASYERLARKMGLEISVVADADNLTLMAELAKSGIGFTILPSTGSYMLRNAEELAHRPIKGLYIRRWIAWRRPPRNRETILLLISMIRTIVTADGSRFGAVMEGSDGR